MKILENKTVKVVGDLEPEPEVADKPGPGPEFVAELVSLQEEASYGSQKL